MTKWVPVSACTLPSEQQPLRAAEFEDLFRSALRRAERRSPSWLQLGFVDTGDGFEGIAELVARESACCSFFSFDLHRLDAETVLEIRVPAAHTAVLDGLHRQAIAAMDARRPDGAADRDGLPSDR